jgi:hypothetical protein
VLDDLLPFDLVLTDSVFQDIGDEVKVLVIFDLCHEHVVTTFWECIVGRRLWVAKDPYRWLS